MGTHGFEDSKISITFRKQRFWKNAIQFAIGLVFCGIAYNYLTINTAERVSISSGFKVIYQKIDVFVHQFVSKNGGLLSEKFKLERNYLELIKTVEGADCKGMIDIPAINKKYQELQNETVESYKENYIEYHQFAGTAYNKIETVCDVNKGKN